LQRPAQVQRREPREEIIVGEVGRPSIRGEHGFIGPLVCAIQSPRPLVVEIREWPFGIFRCKRSLGWLFRVRRRKPASCELHLAREVPALDHALHRRLLSLAEFGDLVFLIWLEGTTDASEQSSPEGDTHSPARIHVDFLDRPGNDYGDLSLGILKWERIVFVFQGQFIGGKRAAD
jgi:hypothetical protein